MTPVIVVVFLLSVIRIFSSFEIELLLGVPWSFYVYSTKIVDLARQEPPLVNQAAALGSIILVFLARLYSDPAQIDSRAGSSPLSQGNSNPKPSISARGVIRRRRLLRWLFLSRTWCRCLSVLGGSFMTRFGFFNLPQDMDVGILEDGA